MKESEKPSGRPPVSKAGRIHELESKIGKLQSERDAAEKVAAEAMARLEALNGDLESVQRKAAEERSSHQKQIEEAVRAALEESGKERSRLKAELEESGKARQAAETQAAEAGAARDASRKELDEARRLAEESGKERDRLKLELAECVKARDAAQLEVARLSSKPAAPPESPAPPVVDAEVPRPAAPEKAPEEPPPPPAPVAESAPKPGSIFDDDFVAPPSSEPAAAAVPQVSGELPPEVVEAASNPANLFGPTASDGKPCHVLVEVLSRDALGSLHRAFDRSLASPFAVRILAGPEEEAQIAALEAEVQKLIGLPHPNLLQVHSTGRHEKRLFIATDLIAATPLGKAEIKDVPRICTILRDVADAVHYAHEEGIIHGDLNPETILVGKGEEQDHAYVKDFGLGYRLEAAQAGLMIRNPAYLPPEKGGPTVASDIYSLGATFYAALAGRAPFEGKDVRQIRSKVMIEEPPPLERTLPGLPGTVSLIIRRAMAKEVGIRFATAMEMADALTRFLEGSVTRVRPNPALVKGT